MDDDQLGVVERGGGELGAAGGLEVRQRLGGQDVAQAGAAAALEPGGELVAVQRGELVDEDQRVGVVAVALEPRGDRVEGGQDVAADVRDELRAASPAAA